MIKSDVAFQHYLTALMKNGYEASINPAVRRRESILAASVPAATVATSDSAEATETPASSPDTSEQTTASATEPTPETSPASDVSTPSSSQKVAQAVLSGQAQAPPSLGGSNPELAKLMSGAEANGTHSNPIQVSIIERKS